MSLFSSALRAARRGPQIFRTLAPRCYVTKITMGDPVEHATGIEKRELLAKMAGNCDPFGLELCKVGTGTQDDPIQIKSAFDSRIVGCICNEEAVYPNWMWLHENECKRCECGRWFTLVPTEPF